MPTPTPTADDIAAVKELAGEKSYTSVETLVNALTDAEWLRALDILGEYDRVKNKFTKVTGRVDVDYERNRQSLRRRIRLLLGLSAATADETMTLPGSLVINRSLGW